jgi:curved DNA-binding protein
VEYKDYYKILGVPRGADAAAIKRAFRKLARTHHPDVNPDDPAAEARFKDIAEAYEVLGDPEKRSRYDRFGQEYRQYERSGGAPGGFDWSAWSQGRPNVTYTTVEDVRDLFGQGGFGGFSDFFETLFGRAAAPRQQMARRGTDIRHPVQISLHEAYKGTTRSLLKEGRRIEVDIPPGVRTGSKVRVKGEGAQGPSGVPSGDLYLEIEVAQDPRFDRRGDDLHTSVEVPLTTAVLGGEVRVTTMDGDVQLKVPAGTQNGRKIRLSGKGMPKLSAKGERGSLLVTVTVRLPRALTAEQRELFERLRELEAGGGSKR